jgi:hypothetical protein
MNYSSGVASDWFRVRRRSGMGAISSVFPAPTDGAVVPDRSFEVAIDQQPVAVSARRAATAASTWWKADERMLFSGKSEEPQRAGGLNSD